MISIALQNNSLIDVLLMQQKVFLICKLYLFFIYFSLDNFNYSLKNLQNSSAKVSWNSRKTFAEEKLAWVLGSGVEYL